MIKNIVWSQLLRIYTTIYSCVLFQHNFYWYKFSLLGISENANTHTHILIRTSRVPSLPIRRTAVSVIRGATVSFCRFQFTPVTRPHLTWERAQALEVRLLRWLTCWSDKQNAIQDWNGAVFRLPSHRCLRVSLLCYINDRVGSNSPRVKTGNESKQWCGFVN